MKRLSFPALLGVVLALVFAGLGSPSFAGSNPVPIYLKADPCPGASLCGNFLTSQFKGFGKRTTSFNALPNLTVTRASFAYGENADGSLKPFQAGQARWTSKGLGVFEATTNLEFWSQAFGNAAWNKSAVTATDNQTAAPDGTTTAAFILPTTSVAEHFVSEAATVTAATYEVSFYAKAGGYTKVGWREATTSGAYCTWNLNGGVVISSSVATCGTPLAVANGWYRLTLTYTGAATSQVQSLYVLPTAYVSGDPHSFTAAGDGTSGAYFWGADVRLGAYPVPYCPTLSGSTATCAADQISLAGVNISQTGTFTASYYMPPLPGASSVRSYVMSVNDSGFARLNIRANDVSGAVPVCVVGDGASAPSLSPPFTAPAGALVRIGCSWTATTAAFGSAGVPPATSGVGLAASLTGPQTINLGPGGSANINSYITGFALYPTAFSSAQIQAATSPVDTSSLSLNFASGLYKTTTPYVRTNLAQWSQQMANAVWGQSALTVTDNALVAPDGTTTGASVNITGSGANYHRQQITVSPSTTYTWSFWAKRGTATDVQYSIFDVTHGANIVAPTSYYALINGTTWVRVWTTFTTPAGTTSVYAYTERDSVTTGTYGVWGAQFE